METYDGDTGRASPVRFFLLDACSLVKLVLKEPGPGNFNVNGLVHAVDNLPHTTWLSLAECYGILKRKRADKSTPISQDEYRRAAYLLARFVGPDGQRPLPLVHLAATNFRKVDLATETDALLRGHPRLDFADALQLATMLHGNLSHYGGRSRTTLVTMDRELKLAAKAAGLVIYDPDHDGYPPPPLL